MPRSRLLCFVVATFLSLAVAAPQARADEPSAADAETALQLFKDGKALRDQGDIPGSVAKFRAAYALVETPITAMELGRTYAMLGKLLEARELLLAVARIPPRKNESQKSLDARRDAEALAAAIQPRLASVTVQVKGASPQSPPKISVDGVVVPAAAANEPRVVNPGHHVVVLDVGGRTTQGEITVEEGQSRSIVLEAPARPEEPPPPPPPPPPHEEHVSHGRSPLVYVGFGTALAGLAVGTVTGLMTLSKAGTLKDECRDNRCPPSAKSDLDSSSTTGTIATVGFIVAGAGIGVGVAGLFLSKSEQPPENNGAPSARLFVSPTGAGLRGTF